PRPPDGPYGLPSHGDDARGHQHDRGRRSRAAFRAARGLPRRQLRVPFLLWRLDEHYEVTFRRPDSPLKLKPSECFKRQCFVSVEAVEVFVKQVIEAIGDDALVFSTVVPHAESSDRPA